VRLLALLNRTYAVQLTGDCNADKTPIRCGCTNVSYRNISSQLTQTEWRLKTGDQLNRRAMFQMDAGIV
jgi:hypothetical protein